MMEHVIQIHGNNTLIKNISPVGKKVLKNELLYQQFTELTKLDWNTQTENFEKQWLRFALAEISESWKQHLQWLQ